MAKIEIYTTQYCGYCRRAKELLARKGVTFTEIDVTADPERRQWLRDRTGRRTVPQIFINGQPYGGYDDIAALERAGRLDALLAEQE
ncbi:MAG: glutaredoxin 3 [Myxococcales bacterium]|nr:glutaredoxin 3 [Myxococcota bacterium]MDW8280825.1 glutaredoxin 3 [Myxococcales bacterium]